MKTLSTLLIGIALSMSVWANDYSGSWYDPENTGHGFNITADSGFGHGIFWYLYRPDGSSAFLVALENCEEFPCAVSLAEPSGPWMGGKYSQKGNTVLGDPVGMVELIPSENGLNAKFELVGWQENCQGKSSGGIIFNGCIGTIKLQRLAF